MTKGFLVVLLVALLNIGCQEKKAHIIIDCTNLPALLAEIKKSDQEIRMESDFSKIDFDLLREVDAKNILMISSIIDQCGMPTSKDVDPDLIEAVFLVLQHSKLKYQKQYFPLLEKSAENGDIRKSSLAKLTDRILVNEGQAQVYGTQLEIDPTTNKTKLHPINDPETVNKRRREVGLEPLEDYLRKHDIKFNTPQLE